MTPMLFFYAALAGGVGAVLRALVDGVVSRTIGTRFPWGIIIVNISGSFILGMLTGVLPGALPILGVGLLGGYTTFSTAMIDALQLWLDGQRRSAVWHLFGTCSACVIAAGLGLLLGSLL